MINNKFKRKYTRIKCTNEVIIGLFFVLLGLQICSCDSKLEKKHQSLLCYILGKDLRIKLLFFVKCVNVCEILF